MKTGEEIAELLNRWEISNEPYLTDKELRELEKGLKFIVGFMHKTKVKPMSVYYNGTLECISLTIKARKEQ